MTNFLIAAAHLGLFLDPRELPDLSTLFSSFIFFILFTHKRCFVFQSYYKSFVIVEILRNSKI